MQKVTLAHNTDQPISDIDNGDPADPPLGKELATACTDMSGSTVITPVVITSIARIETFPA